MQGRYDTRHDYEPIYHKNSKSTASHSTLLRAPIAWQAYCAVRILASWQKHKTTWDLIALHPHSWRFSCLFCSWLTDYPHASQALCLSVCMWVLALTFTDSSCSSCCCCWARVRRPWWRHVNTWKDARRGMQRTQSTIASD